MGQNELAEALEASTATVSGWFNEKKKQAYPGGAFLVQLPELLDVDGHWLLTGEGTMERRKNPAPRAEERGATLEPIGDRERLDIAEMLGAVQSAVLTGGRTLPTSDRLARVEEMVRGANEALRQARELGSVSVNER